MERPASLVFIHMDNLIFFPVFKHAEDALPRQFTCEAPAASVPSSANYIYVAFILWDLTVRCGGGALCRQDVESIFLPFSHPFES